jgi:hypothetical protein
LGLEIGIWERDRDRDVAVAGARVRVRVRVGVGVRVRVGAPPTMSSSCGRRSGESTALT